jgi:ribosomal protein L7/L12
MRPWARVIIIRVSSDSEAGMTEEMGFIAVAVLCVAALISILGTRITSLERRLAALSAVDAKLDLLLQHAGLKYDPYKSVPDVVVEAVRAGKKIQAIKRYREATGVGLKEAKDFVEELQRRAGIS